MSPKKLPPKAISCSPNLTLSELEQSKDTVLNVLASAHSRRSYKHAIDKFISWFQTTQPRRLGLSR